MKRVQNVITYLRKTVKYDIIFITLTYFNLIILLCASTPLIINTLNLILLNIVSIPEPVSTITQTTLMR